MKTIKPRGTCVFNLQCQLAPKGFSICRNSLNLFNLCHKATCPQPYTFIPAFFFFFCCWGDRDPVDYSLLIVTNYTILLSFNSNNCNNDIYTHCLWSGTVLSALGIGTYWFSQQFWKWVSSSPLCRWENWGPESLGNLSEVMKLRRRSRACALTESEMELGLQICFHFRFSFPGRLLILILVSIRTYSKECSLTLQLWLWTNHLPFLKLQWPPGKSHGEWMSLKACPWVNIWPLTPVYIPFSIWRCRLRTHPSIPLYSSSLLSTIPDREGLGHTSSKFQESYYTEFHFVNLGRDILFINLSSSKISPKLLELEEKPCGIYFTRDLLLGRHCYFV